MGKGDEVNKSYGFGSMAALLGVACATGAACYFFLTRSSSELAELSKEFGSDGDAKIVEILQDYSRGLFDQLYELAQTASRVIENLEARNLRHMISAPDLSAMLLTDERRASFDKILEDIIAKHQLNMTIQQFEYYTSSLLDTNELLTKYKKGIESMFTDAMSGNIPILPGLDIPYDVSSKETLNLLDKVLREKRLDLDVIFKNKELMKGSIMDPAIGFVPTSEASEIILRTASDAEIRALLRAREHEDRGLDMGLRSVDEKDVVISFKSLLGFYCREDPIFVEKRAELMQRHTQQIITLISQSLENDEINDSIPKAVRSHPIVRKVGGIDILDSITEIPIPSTEKLSMNATQSDITSMINDWGYSLVIVCTGESMPGVVTAEKQKQSLTGKIENLVLSDLANAVKSDMETFGAVHFATMSMQELKKCDAIPHLEDRFDRLTGAVTGAKDLAHEALPVVLFVPNTSAGCIFASRDVEEVLRRVEGHVANSENETLVLPPSCEDEAAIIEPMTESLSPITGGSSVHGGNVSDPTELEHDAENEAMQIMKGATSLVLQDDQEASLVE